MYFTLTTLLVDPTDKRLLRLRNALSASFWERPFFEQADGELLSAVPVEVPRFIDGLEAKLRYVSERTETTRDEALSALRAHLEESCYWKWRTSGRVRAAQHPWEPEPTTIDKISFYAGGSGDDTAYEDLEIDRTVMALYRYGYFNAERGDAEHERG